jgi:hypothetical protein
MKDDLSLLILMSLVDLSGFKSDLLLMIVMPFCSFVEALSEQRFTVSHFLQIYIGWLFLVTKALYMYLV